MQQEETASGEGAMGWGEVRGIVQHGREGAILCPRHLSVLTEFISDVMELGQ